MPGRIPGKANRLGSVACVDFAVGGQMRARRSRTAERNGRQSKREQHEKRGRAGVQWTSTPLFRYVARSRNLPIPRSPEETWTVQRLDLQLLPAPRDREIPCLMKIPRVATAPEARRLQEHSHSTEDRRRSSGGSVRGQDVVNIP
jgi:hypothetical protein